MDNRDKRKLAEIGMWVISRGAIIGLGSAFAYVVLKVGQIVLRLA